MIKKSQILPFAILLLATSLFAQDNLQDVTDRGSTTTNQIQVTNANGMLFTNTNISSGYNSLKIGQFGASTQFIRFVPFRTDSSDNNWGSEFYYDFLNSQWGVDGEFVFNGKVFLNSESGNGLDYGERWVSYAIHSSDSWIVAHSGTGGAELQIKNVDGTVENSQVIVGGKVGIGTTSPDEALDVAGNLKIGISDGDLIFGSNASHIRENSNSLEFISHASLRFYIDELDNSSADKFQIFGNQVEGSSTGSLFTVVESGNVGIGIDNPDAKLVVDGTIKSEEVKVEVVGAPDYVFASGYELRTLEETKKYIEENQHLPEIPSAAEMEQNGVELGEMNMMLLKKIEELTLHLINQQSEIKELHTELNELKSQLNQQ